MPDLQWRRRRDAALMSAPKRHANAAIDIPLADIEHEWERGVE